MDYGQQETERILKSIEKRINNEYAIAMREIEDELSVYFAKFEKKDETWRRWVANGERTKEEYQQWRIGQMAVGRRWADQKESIAKQLVDTSKTALGYVRKYSPEIYAENYNYSTWQIEHDASIDTAFTLWSKESVNRLIEKDSDIAPPVGKKLAAQIKEGKAVKWNKQQLQSVMIQGILQGDSIPKLATRLATKVADKDRKASIRNARTISTGVQNSGRVDAYKRAQDKGVELEQMWLATMDNRTRHSHRWLDGEVRPVGEAFSNGCEYPADPKGDPAEIYNCRCRLRAVVKGLERRSGQFRDNSAIGGISYDEWRNAKAKSEKITKPDEAAKNAKGSYLDNYRENGNIFKKDTGAHSVSYNAEPVRFNKDAEYKVRIPEYSDKVNESISKASRMVAEMGSKKGYEYSALVDTESGAIPYMGTSRYDDSVNSYFKYLEKHPDKNFVMVHNHGVEVPLSYPDVEQLAYWNNLDTVVATTNNGITFAAQSNGVKTTEYLEGRYAGEYRRVMSETHDRVAASNAMAQKAMEDLCKGGVYEYDGRR